MWCLPGGHLEEGESPRDCVVREIGEELGVRLRPEQVRLFCSADRSYGREHTFWSAATFTLEEVVLTEGQDLRWFSEDEVNARTLGYEDNEILRQFFGSRSRLAAP